MNSPMTARPPVRRGLGACAAAALLSVFMPGTGHWMVRARFRSSVITASVLNVAAMVAMLVIVAPARDRAGLTELIADRGRFVAMGLALVVLAGTRVFTAIDAAWVARPIDGAALKLIAGLATAAAGRPVPGEPSGPAVPYPRCPAAGRARHRRGCHRGQRSRRKDCSSVAGRCRWGCSCDCDAPQDASVHGAVSPGSSSSRKRGMVRPAAEAVRT